MMIATEQPVMKVGRRLLILLTLCWLCDLAAPAAGQTGIVVMPTREDAIVDSASAVLAEIMAIPARGIPAALLCNAEGIVIIPGMLKGGFIVGVRHGRGVIVTRDEAGNWKAPLFVTITGGSFGWQIGIQGTDLVLVFRTKRSLENLMSGKFTIGAHASAAAGPVGREAEAATDARLQAEILSYSRSRGLFAGLALDGAVLTVDRNETNTYYQSANYNVNEPGQPGSLPASAGRLLEQIAKYTTTTVIPCAATSTVTAPPVVVDAATLRRQLADSWKRLETGLDPAWRTFLALPAEVLSGDRAPSSASLHVSLDRFADVAGNPSYQSLSQRPEFQNTWLLLSQYTAAVETGAGPTLALPLPPK